MAVDRACDIYLTLRPRQVAYLQEIAKWDEIPEGHAMVSILERFGNDRLLLDQRGGLPVRKHFSSTPSATAILEGLTTRWGTECSEAARALIDMSFAIDRLRR